MISPHTDTTPAGLQTRALLFKRRLIVAGLNGITYLALLYWLASILSVSGWSVIDIAIFACFAIAAPWSVLGVWNAFLGVWLLHGGKDARHAVAPFAASGDGDAPVTARTAILMTIRNEDPGARLRPCRGGEGLPRRHRAGRRVRLFRPVRHQRSRCRPAEERAFAAWKARAGDVRRPAVLSSAHVQRGLQGRQPARLLRALGRRLRTDAAARRRQPHGRRDDPAHGAHRRRPSRSSASCRASSSARRAQSAFARIFQFGMRHGMRPYTMGSAWWAGDCGPFWGHNALVRIAPFMEHCDLPILPGGPPLGGQIMSHDQVEAVLMRRAGYEVRVLPAESRQLGGKSAHDPRIHPPRPALVPGQHAVLPPARHGRPAAR